MTFGTHPDENGMTEAKIREGCTDGMDAHRISHCQDGVGYRLQVTRKTDGASLTKSVDLNGAICVWHKPPPERKEPQPCITHVYKDDVQ